jgi:UDP-N-acetylglucosamine 3-dehydrogenase
MLKVAVIGVGAMGIHHVRNYASLPNARIVAVCDQNSSLGNSIAKEYNTKFYSDYNQLIENEDVDAVSIVVPTSLHTKVALTCIKKNISVLIEKPLASSVQEAKKIIAAAAKQNVVLAVGHIERFNPGVMKLHEIISKGIIGDILSIVVKRVGLFPPRIKDVDVVTDLAVHDLDIITNLVGNLPISVTARGGNSIANRKEDHAEIFLDYDKFGCFIQVNWITPIKIRNIAITGSKGYAELNYVTQKLELYKTVNKKNKTLKFKEFVVELGEPKKIDIYSNKVEPLKLELENFLSAVKNKRMPKVSGEDGLKAVTLSQKVLESIRSKKTVKIRSL